MITYTANIVVVPKLSKYERDLRRYNLSHDELVKKYKSEGVDADRIIDSHYRQREAADIIMKLVGKDRFVERGALTQDVTRGVVVVALGGDDHFKYVSHFVDDSPLLGVNSDPIRSRGALTTIKACDFGRALDAIHSGDYFYEEWTRLQLNLNGNGAGLAVSECFIGSADSEDISHYIVELNGKAEEQKSSGLVVATGAGSTGWYRSAGRYVFGKKGDVFPRTDRMAKFVMREPYGDDEYRMNTGIVNETSELVITSLQNGDERISLDSTDRFEFNRGSRARITISKPLRVVTLD